MADRHEAETLPVIYSLLAPEAVLAEARAAWGLRDVATCALLRRGMNDMYLLRSGNERYVLRVNRWGWRSRGDVLYEVELLLHLGTEGVPVALPLPRRNGTYTLPISAPEGPRHAVLFTYVPGTWLPLDSPHSERFGEVAALMHRAADTFAGAGPRVCLDLDELLEIPLQVLSPFLADRPDDWQYLMRLADRLRAAVMPLTGELEWGVCHGDLHPGNAHAAEGHPVTLFDFEFAGPGWRIDDIATFCFRAKLDGRDRAEELWSAFLRGYSRHRRLGDADLRALPLFVALRQIWLLGQQAEATRWAGLVLLDDARFDRSFRFLREWQRDYLDQSRAMRVN